MAAWPSGRDGSSAASGSNSSETEKAATRDNERDVRDLRSDFNSLLARYEKPIYNLIFQWIRDSDEAFDLTQETFISAYRASGTFRAESKVYTWLYRIALNHCKNRFKQRDRQKEFEAVSLDEGFSADAESPAGETRDVADWSLAPDQLLEQKELRAQIYKAVDALPSEYRTVLVLREMEGLNYLDIAEVTGLSMEAVKTRLSRARGMIRRRIEPYYRL
ncbi:MAG: sigma-70 family RNA polymerase sigma factor [Capsulimonadaceae bacterium]|nr:sigma-70 family RNA polymerase sigma factor [Capsulimonadaceae bacterium]